MIFSRSSFDNPSSSFFGMLRELLCYSLGYSRDFSGSSAVILLEFFYEFLWEFSRSCFNNTSRIFYVSLSRNFCEILPGIPLENFPELYQKFLRKIFSDFLRNPKFPAGILHPQEIFMILFRNLFEMCSEKPPRKFFRELFHKILWKRFWMFPEKFS